MRRRSRLALLLSLPVALGLTGCSSFRHDARIAREQAVPAKGIEGLWEGRWEETGKPGHGGAMQLVFTRTGDTVYRAAARSRWRKVFTSAYDFMAVVTPTAPDEYLVKGGKDIWPFGGYTFTGTADATTLRGTFRIGKQEGTLDLHRPSGGTNP